MTSLTQRAREWIATDPDPDTVTELTTLLSDEAALRDRFSGPLEFGTAGLRGVIGAGESRMNAAVVITTTDALARVLAEKVPNAKSRGIVIGYDGRTKSHEFARAAARIASAHGFRVWLFAEVAPTPLTAFAVLHSGAAAGVMVTASHNPPEYNGYKVYWGNGAQIITPIDAWVRDAAVASVARGAKLLLAEAADGRWDAAPQDWRDQYRAEALRLRARPEVALDAVSIAYTPMHGVGGDTAVPLLEQAGVKVHSVRQQYAPDAAFPTVKFPNPEEPGAMDLVNALALQARCDLSVANDPDADRLAIAVREGETMRMLTGNQIGTLLGAYILCARTRATLCARTRTTLGADERTTLGADERTTLGADERTTLGADERTTLGADERTTLGADDHATPTGGAQRPALVAASVVSSHQLERLAKLSGAVYFETLTGFKWIANGAIDRAGQGDFVFGYEEALGFTVGTLVRDKDGISAALLFCELVGWLKASGRTVAEYEREIAAKTGVFASLQRSFTLKGADGIARMKQVMATLRAAPPAQVGSEHVQGVRDYAHGGELPPTDMVRLDFDRAQLIVRPSGTEPKLKIYAEASEGFAAGDDYAAAQGHAAQRCQMLATALATALGL